MHTSKIRLQYMMSTFHWCVLVGLSHKYSFNAEIWNTLRSLMPNRQKSDLQNNTKENLLRTNAAIWFNEMCRVNHLPPVINNTE